MHPAQSPASQPSGCGVKVVKAFNTMHTSIIPTIIIACLLITLITFRHDLMYLEDNHRDALALFSSVVMAVCLLVVLMPIFYALFG